MSPPEVNWYGQILQLAWVTSMPELYRLMQGGQELLGDFQKRNKDNTFAGCKEAWPSSDLLQHSVDSYWHLAASNPSLWSEVAQAGRGCGGRSWSKVGLKRSWQESSPRKAEARKYQEASWQKGKWLKAVSTTLTTWGNNRSSRHSSLPLYKSILIILFKLYDQKYLM